MDIPRITLGAVNIEAADPQALAAFWAEAMGGTPVASDVTVYLPPASADGFAMFFQPLGRERPVGGTPHVRWTTLADPEGDVFCVAEHPPAS